MPLPEAQSAEVSTEVTDVLTRFRVTRPMLGFKSFAAAQDTLVGIELMHMIKKRQLMVEEEDEGLTAAELFYSLAA